MRGVILVLTLALLTSASLTAAAVTTETTPCLRVADFGIPWVTHLAGDVDGDRSPDIVKTHARWMPDGGCRAWLSVDTGDRRLRTPIEPARTPLVKPPGLAALIELRPGRSLDIAVVVWLGASTGFLDVYGVRHGRLGRISRDEFAYGGSVVNVSGVDCVRGHSARLVSTEATYAYADDRYHVVRRFFRLHHEELLLVPRLMERWRVPVDELGRFPELASAAPFPGCTVVYGAS